MKTFSFSGVVGEIFSFFIFFNVLKFTKQQETFRVLVLKRDCNSPSHKMLLKNSDIPKQTPGGGVVLCTFQFVIITSQKYKMRLHSVKVFKEKKRERENNLFDLRKNDEEKTIKEI